MDLPARIIGEAKQRRMATLAIIMMYLKREIECVSNSLQGRRNVAQYFHSVVVVGLGYDFLFKSHLGHCEMWGFAKIVKTKKIRPSRGSNPGRSG